MKFWIKKLFYSPGFWLFSLLIITISLRAQNKSSTVRASDGTTFKFKALEQAPDVQFKWLFRWGGGLAVNAAHININTILAGRYQLSERFNVRGKILFGAPINVSTDSYSFAHHVYLRPHTNHSLDLSYSFIHGTKTMKAYILLGTKPNAKGDWVRYKVKKRIPHYRAYNFVLGINPISRRVNTTKSQIFLNSSDTNSSALYRPVAHNDIYLKAGIEWQKSTYATFELDGKSNRHHSDSKAYLNLLFPLRQRLTVTNVGGIVSDGFVSPSQSLLGVSIGIETMTLRSDSKFLLLNLEGALLPGLEHPDLFDNNYYFSLSITYGFGSNLKEQFKKSKGG